MAIIEQPSDLIAPSSPAQDPGGRARRDPELATPESLVVPAVRLAREWAELTASGESRAEAKATGRLASLVADPAGLDLAVQFVDKVARPEDTRGAARELSRIDTAAAGRFLGATDRVLLEVGSRVARVAPGLVVPLARRRLRQLVGHLVVDAAHRPLTRHLAAARADGFRLNVNLLGEAVLGEREAASRAARTIALLERGDVDYVSIKVSSLVSQISTWDTEGTLERVLGRLRPLYRAAARRSPAAFVNLDMEEYRDLDLTVEVFTALLSEPEFAGLEAGIVLQAYLPDAAPAFTRLVDFARARVAAGGAGIKVRLVKGANLAMEHVEAELHGWAPAPYGSKEQVDANFVAIMDAALRPDVAGAVRLGVASHNLFHVALAHLLAAGRGVSDALDVEMLQGMAPAQARAVRADVGSVLLYTPVVARADFDVAVSYLVRRLEENSAPQNFLHAFFAPGPGTADPLADQERRFRASVAAARTVVQRPQRTAERAPISPQAPFANAVDSDPALPAVRAWARAALATDAGSVAAPELAGPAEVDEVVTRAVRAQAAWGALPPAARAVVLESAAEGLERRRAELLGVMAHEAGKTAGEADPELSEAVDFAHYYARSARELPEAGFEPVPVTLVTPPWNFPVAIGVGGLTAALAAGSAVIVKLAPQTPRSLELAVESVAEALAIAGHPGDTVQVVRTDEGETGRSLVSHPQVDQVILTGATQTARLFSSWRAGRPGGPRVFAETSGKNALIITPSADYDLAVADLARSAFGHAGQKCSAASLAILVGSAGDSDRLRGQLIDAVSSLRVGPPDDLGAGMGPLVEEPSGKLLRALTTLEDGESWLVEPRRVDDAAAREWAGQLWTPGVRDGVAPGSFFHLTECFGPVLGIMRARDLDEAIGLANAVGFGLTGGIHSLDSGEVEQWLEQVEVGNAYVNRHITGAIVQRQPFGGWKDSVVGPGAKAGGPNYVAQLGRWTPTEAVPGDSRSERASARQWLDAARASDAELLATRFAPSDRSGLSVEENTLRYRPVPQLTVRAGAAATRVAVRRVLAAAEAAGAPVALSAGDRSLLRGVTKGRGAAPVASGRVETDRVFAARVRSGDVTGRVRVVGEDDPALHVAAAEGGATILAGPVLADGGRELLAVLREQAISRTRHRFGHLSASA